MQYVSLLISALRGAAALELRAADVRGIGSTNSASVRASLQKGTTLRVCLLVASPLAL